MYLEFSQYPVSCTFRNIVEIYNIHFHSQLEKFMIKLVQLKGWMYVFYNSFSIGHSLGMKCGVDQGCLIVVENYGSSFVIYGQILILDKD